jgi:hypothetical protein
MVVLVTVRLKPSDLSRASEWRAQLHIDDTGTAQWEPCPCRTPPYASSPRHRKNTLAASFIKINLNALSLERLFLLSLVYATILAREQVKVCMCVSHWVGYILRWNHKCGFGFIGNRETAHLAYTMEFHPSNLLCRRHAAVRGANKGLRK